jgi:hypothetical protein
MNSSDPGLGPEVGSCGNIMNLTFEFHKTRIVHNAIGEHTDTLLQVLNPFSARGADLSTSAVFAKNAGGRCIGPFLSSLTVAVPYIGC